MKKFFRKEKGFTLLEMIFAITIISIGVLGVHNAMNFAIKSTREAREYFMGAYLAQEGIEIVKNIRDTNWVEGAADWKEGLTACSAGCQASYASTSLSAYTGDYLSLDANGFYFYDPGPSPNFSFYRRKITVEDIGTDELGIVVDVSWANQSGSTVTTTVRENIWNWYK